jgi:ribosomal protein S27E
MVKKKREYISFHEDGNRFMQCKHCQSEYVQTSEEAVAVTCSLCTQRLCLSHMSLEEMMPSLRKKVSTGRPPGWHFMNEFVDKKGNVFHKGKEQPELKGTLKPTKVKPIKKRKKLTKDEKLYKEINKWKKRKKARTKNK